MAPTAIGKVMRALKPKPLVQAAARRAGAELLAAAVGEAGPARLLAAAGGWLAACVAALRPGEDAAVQRGTWRALAGAPGARREGAALVGRLMPAALPLLQAPPGARSAPSPPPHSAGQAQGRGQGTQRCVLGHGGLAKHLVLAAQT